MFLNPRKNLLQAGLSEGMFVAEFGAGSGHYVFAASELVGNTGRVYSVDIQHDLLRKIANEAEKHGRSNVEVIWGDLEKDLGSAIRAGIVDIVIVANTLFQIGNKDKYAEEVKRVLKKKGRLLLVEWADNQGGIGPHKNHLIKKGDAIKLFENAGFKLEKEIEAGDHHYGLIFRNS